MVKSINRYNSLIKKVFFDRYDGSLEPIVWKREDLVSAANELSIPLPKNLGDVIYSIRYRNPMPDSIVATQPAGREWVISGLGRAQYQFRLVSNTNILPRSDLVSIKIPDSTPEIITSNALGDEQALLAKVRYNRLIDLFVGVVAYSLQNHLRTTVNDIGQIEIDEIYVGIDKRGRQFILPVQAKGGADRLGFIQTEQDILCCKEKFPNLICRSISAQFMPGNVIAMFELTIEGDDLKIVEEKHYKLVPSSDIAPHELLSYDIRS
ncbi:endonuclease [Thalassospira mesophila]|uniref:Endonuclease n=1 Tax=Thalassospira mesophila TaxID=1293891 RepID=A0A1Y2L3N8_9PROT|nr:endonuclease [Thalassospira mesophila]OSQ39834.1 endonuclease [Thalassospira mesophila]